MSQAVAAKIDSAISELQEAKRLVEVIEVVPSEPDPTPGGEPSQIILPRESTSELNRFYGTASRSNPKLSWFDFPSSQMRLYSREGAHLSDHNGNDFDDHRCHTAIADRLESAYRALYNELGREQFMAEGWHVYSGCFNFRTKTGGSSLSTHAWGIAVDINSTDNPYRQTTTTFSDKGIDIMERFGFLSGGRAWGKDWMHFQAVIPNISSGSYYARNGLPKWIKAA